MITAEDRRNARIKKILENSEQRLLKISGVENKRTVTEFDDVKFYHNSKESPHNTMNGVKTDDAINNIESHSFLEHTWAQRLTTGTTYKEGQNVSNIPSEMSQAQIKQVLKTNSDLKLIHILAIAFIQNFVFIILDFLKIDGSTLYLGNIFLPLMAYDIYYYIFHSKEITSPSFLNLLLSNYLKSNTTKYLKLFMCIVQIMQDVMVYFVTFIVLSKSLIILKTFANILYI